jgi:hypothetical protein
MYLNKAGDTYFGLTDLDDQNIYSIKLKITCKSVLKQLRSIPFSKTSIFTIFLYKFFKITQVMSRRSDDEERPELPVISHSMHEQTKSLNHSWKYETLQPKDYANSVNNTHRAKDIDNAVAPSHNPTFPRSRPFLPKHQGPIQILFYDKQ